jgi:hypothetical protein
MEPLKNITIGRGRLLKKIQKSRSASLLYQNNTTLLATML